MKAAAEPNPPDARPVRSVPTPRELLRTLHALSLGALLGLVLARVPRARGRPRPVMRGSEALRA